MFLYNGPSETLRETCINYMRAPHPSLATAQRAKASLATAQRAKASLATAQRAKAGVSIINTMKRKSIN